MKRALFSFLFIVLTSVAFAQVKKAVKYNDQIIDEQHKITTKMVKFFETFEKGTLEEMKKEKDELNLIIDNSIKVVSAMEPFKGDADFRDHAVELFKFYKSTLQNEYEQMIPLIADRDRSVEDHKKLDEFKEKLIKEEEEISDKFAKIQEEFATRHNLVLIEHPIK